MGGIGPFELMMLLAMGFLFLVVPLGVVIWAFMDKARRDREREQEKDGESCLGSWIRKNSEGVVMAEFL